jgi:hypothetical protein
MTRDCTGHEAELRHHEYEATQPAPDLSALDGYTSIELERWRGLSDDQVRADLRALWVLFPPDSEPDLEMVVARIRAAIETATAAGMLS